MQAIIRWRAQYYHYFVDQIQTELTLWKICTACSNKSSVFFLSGPVELPAGADVADNQYDENNDNNVQAVLAESDNYLVDQSEYECNQVDLKLVLTNGFLLQQ